MKYYTELPHDLIVYINNCTNIKCHICKKKFNINFFKKLSKNYYCSKICYEFI